MLDTFGHMQYLYGNTVGIASTFYFDSNSGFLLGFSWQYLGLRFWRSVIICNSQHTEFGWIWTNQIFWIIYGQSWLSWIALDNVYIFSLYYISHVLVSFSFFQSEHFNGVPSTYLLKNLSETFSVLFGSSSSGAREKNARGKKRERERERREKEK